MSPTLHKLRLRAALAGEPVDRVPLALWWHDFPREWSAEGLAAATIAAYRTYDWDLVKLNPRATYYAEAWGSRYEPTGTTQPRPISHALKRIEELADITPIDPTAGVFGEQLDALRRVVAIIGDEVDVIQTVFHPLTVASALSTYMLAKNLRVHRHAECSAAARAALGSAAKSRRAGAFTASTKTSSFAKSMADCVASCPACW